MVDSLSSALNAQIERFDALLKSVDVADYDDAVLVMPVGTSMSCAFEVDLLEPGDGGPSVEAHAHVEPGGRIGEAQIEARDGSAFVSEDIEPGSGLHRALGVWFTSMWDGWDDVPEGIPGELLGLRGRDLLPGDRLFRFDLTVASVEDNGINSAGKSVVAVRYEDAPGTDVWPDDREFTVIRNTPDGAAGDWDR